MPTAAYAQRRDALETYFDRTAKDAWEQLTSDAPVSKIRATVRAGRDRMRATLLSWLPEDLAGRSVLDAGCGTGAFCVEAARRGAHVTGVELAGTLIDVARARTPEALAARIAYRVGDMLDPALGRFDHVVCMDSLIHYPAAEIVRVLTILAERTSGSIVFTFAPRTPALSAMHAAGKLFPRADRAPAIEPVGEARLRSLIQGSAELSNWRVGRVERVQSGFYTSQAMELARK